MDSARRQVMLAGLSFGLAAFVFPRLLRAHETIVPGGGYFDQTTLLQDAADRAALSGIPLFLPEGIYATKGLSLKSGTQIEGVPGRTVFRHCGGGSILRVEQAEDVRLSGLVLDGNHQALGSDGALLMADDVSGLAIRECHFIGSSEDGVALHCVSGRIAGCTMSQIGGTALSSVECCDLAIMDNRIEHAATGLSLSGAPSDHSVVVRGNVIRDLFLRKTLMHSGIGIVADGGAIISGNVIDGAPAYGILIDGNAPRIAGNLIRNAYSDIAVSEPLSWPGGEARTA